MLRELWLESKQPDYDAIDVQRMVEYAHKQSEVLQLVTEKFEFAVPFDSLQLDHAIELMTKARQALSAVQKLKPGPTRAKHNKRVLSYFSQVKSAVSRMLKQAQPSVAGAENEEMDVDIDQFIDQHMGGFDDLPLPPEEDPDVRRMQQDRHSAAVNRDIEDIDKEIYDYDFDEDEEYGVDGGQRDQVIPSTPRPEVDGQPEASHGCCCRCRCCDDQSSLGTIGESLFKRTFTEYLVERADQNDRFIMDSHEYRIMVSAKGRGQQQMKLFDANGQQIAFVTVDYDAEQVYVDSDTPHPASISYFEFVDDMDNVDWVELGKATVAAVEY